MSAITKAEIQPKSWYIVNMDDGVTDGPYRTKREALAEHVTGYPYTQVHRYAPGSYEYTVGYDIEDCWTVNVVTGERAIIEGCFHEDNEEEGS